MLTYFPTPYPGEWWYSVLCRYHVRSGYSKHATTISELYGDHPMVHGRLIPGGDCATILSNLPPGVLSIDDVLVILQTVVQEKTLSGTAFENADMNGDGRVTTTDARLCLRMVAGKEE